MSRQAFKVLLWHISTIFSIASFNLKLVPIMEASSNDASSEVVATKCFLEKLESKMYFSRFVNTFIKWGKLVRTGNSNCELSLL